MITSAPWVTTPNQMNTENISKIFRIPGRSDGILVHELISLCPPLDENSAYCNFLQSIHFRETCVLVEENDKVIGFVSAYIKPDDKQTLFIWQVSVHPNARGAYLKSLIVIMAIMEMSLHFLMKFTILMVSTIPNTYIEFP